MKSFEFLFEDSTTLNKLYKGDFPDRDESFWDYVTSEDFDKDLKIEVLPKHKLQIMLLSQYRVEHLDELLDMMDDDQKETLEHYMQSPSLSNSIILIANDRIIDGNHRALAAAMKNAPIKYIDLDNLQ